jgi:hypothetical protein
MSAFADYLRTLTRHTPYQRGFLAQRDGVAITANPFPDVPCQVAEYPGKHAEWRAGWMLAQGWEETKTPPE